MELPVDPSASVSRRAFLTAGVTTTALLGCAPDSIPAPEREGPPTRPTADDDAAWAHVRARFMLDEGVTYMNNASLGLPPREVARAVCDGYEAISREPLHGKHDLQEVIAQDVVPGLASFVGADADEISLTRNATEGLHLQAVGLQLEPGDEVLITTQEHPAGNAPWRFREERDGIRVTEVFVPSPLPSADEVVELMAAAVTARTRAISFCHATRGGHVYPVRALTEMAHARGLLCLVDGAQALGQFPIDLHEVGCDAYSASLHKWAFGPVGTGFMYVSVAARDRIRTSFAPNATVEAPALAPGGTADFPVRAALATSLDFCNALGLDRIERRCRYLSDHLKAGLQQIPGITILSGATDDISAPGSTIFEKAGLDAMEAVPWLEEVAGTHIDEHQRDGHNAIRVSTHVYNTTGEIDRLLDAVSTS